MKILAIRGANLASLKGAFEVDLASPPLCHLGLFAIAGPVGAGKSTLLDAMCLALFNRTPRLSGHGGAPVVKDADALKSNDPRSLVRRGAAGAFAEVDLRAVDGRTYRARWQVRRARGQAFGKLMNAELSLVDMATGFRIGDGTTDTLARIEEKLGLSFDELCRSMLLAQGSFSSFLKARPEERAQLLEKITGTEIYSTLSMRAFGRARVEEAGLVALEDQMRALAPATPLQRVALENGVDEAHHHCEVRARIVERAEERARHAARAAELAALVREAEGGRQALEDDRASSAAAARVAALTPVWPLRSSWRVLDEARAGSTRLQRELERAREDERAAKEGAAALMERATRASDVLSTKALALADAQPLLEKAIVLDEQLARSVTRALLAEHETAVREDADRRAAMEQLRAAHAAAHGARRAADEALAAEPALTKVAPVWPSVVALLEQMARAHTQREGAAAIAANARLRRDEAREALHAADAALVAASERERATSQALATCLGGAPSCAPDAAATIASAAALLDERARSAARIDAIVKELEAQRVHEETAAHQARAAEAALQRAEDDLANVSALTMRAALTPGAPCPVCGSADHPHTDGEKVDGEKVDGEAHAQVDAEVDADVDVAAVALAARERAQEERAAASRWSTAKALLTESARQLQEARAAFASLSAGTVGTLVDAHAIAHAWRALDAWRAALDAKVAAQSGVDEAAQALLVEEQSMLLQTDALARLDAEHAERAGAARDMLGAELCAKERVLTSPREAARALHERVSALRDHMDAARSAAARLADIEAKLRPLEIAAGASAARLYELTTRLDAARREDARITAARKSLFGGEASSLVRKKLVDAVDEARDARSSVERELAQADARALAARARVDEKLQAVNKAVAHEDACQATFMAAVEAAGVSAEQVAHAAALDDDALDAARDAVRALDDACARAEAVLGERRALAAAHAANAPAPAEPGELACSLEEARSLLAAALEARSNARAALARDDEVRARAAQLAPELEAQRKKAHTWTALGDVIGSSDGARFRVFAQSLTLDALLVRANEQLAMLAPRYRLQRVPTDDQKRPRFDLELVVIDRESGDEPRGTASLSGGETFLVSLALALGLSSLSSSRTPVESLFIDEGFSSLDAETLEAALAALEALRATGRQIGVISHVPALVERIGAQVRVVPLGGGRSRVDVRAG